MHFDHLQASLSAPLPRLDDEEDERRKKRRRVEFPVDAARILDAASLAGVAVLGLSGAAALAQTFPAKPVRLVVTFPTGGAPDTLARIFSEKAQLGQAVVVEKLFAWPGVGSLMVDSVFQRDIPTVQGCILLIVLFFLFINTLVDLAYVAIDPRIRYR